MKRSFLSYTFFILLFFSGINSYSQNNVTITAGTLDCDNYGNNDIRFSPSAFPGNGTQQVITVTFAQYQCERCKQITFTKNNGSAVRLVKDVASGAFAVTGVQRNPSVVSNTEVAGNRLSFNGINCGWDVGDVSITLYLKYEQSTNTLYFSSNPAGGSPGSTPGGGDDGIHAAASQDDLILGRGGKQFIFSTQMENPDNPPVVFIAPKQPGSSNFDWSKQITLTSDGSLLLSTGNLGIGTLDPQYKLDVDGTIHARELLVDLQDGGADFVFDENYPLRSLDEVSGFIQANKHLPEIPSAADMVNNGLDMGEFQIKLLQKIEELTLYVIEQNRQLKEQQEEINKLKNR